MKCELCGSLYEERYDNLHKKYFCEHYTTFNDLLKENKWFRRAFIGYLMGVFAVAGWIMHWFGLWF